MCIFFIYSFIDIILFTLTTFQLEIVTWRNR